MIKLLNVKLLNHPVLGNQLINFIDPNEEKGKQYISLIIGQNGTGKTQILKTIVDILLALNSHLNSDKYIWNGDYDFYAEIYKDGKILSFKSRDNFIFTTIEKDKILKSNLAPSMLLVSAYTFNDKLPKIDSNKFYYYGGLKTASNNIFLNVPAQDTFLNLSKIILTNEKAKFHLNELFEELDFEKKIQVTYKRRKNYSSILGSSKLWDFIFKVRSQKSDSISARDLQEFKKILVNLIKYPGKSIRFKDSSIERALKSDESLIELIKYFRDNQVQYVSSPKNKIKGTDVPIKLTFQYSWGVGETQNSENHHFVHHLSVYKTLSELDVVSFDKFHVYRKTFFSFEDASSGEFHLLHLVCSILANIKDNSVVLIDEPEISLHFNWQNRFFKLMEPIINNYKSCHYIIATHSHFLVSNLHKKSSSIISMKRKDGILDIRNLTQIDTEGWSAEQILFDVFNVASDRNYYMSLLVDEIVKEMSSSRPRLKIINEKKARLEELNLSNMHDSDPFKKIIKSLLEK